MRWLISLLLGAAGGYVAARAATRQELDEFRRELASQRSGNGRPAEAAPAARPPEPAAPEAPAEPPPVPVPAEEPAAPPAGDEEAEVDERTAMLIAAAVAAYLGKRAVVRRVRVVAHRSGDPWAVYGRVHIHASHNVVQAHVNRS